MTGYKPVNDRIITVSMSGQTEYNTDLCSDERNWSGMYGRFLCSLWRNNDEDPSREITVIAGDFNAKIGDTTQDDDLWNIVGKSGLGKRNNRGEHLLQFGASIGIYICNLGFRHRHDGCTHVVHLTVDTKMK